MLRIKLLILLLTFIVQVFGQQKHVQVTEVHALKDYQKDFKKLTHLLVKYHPKTFAFISKDEFRKLTKSQYKKITDSTSIGQFLWICKRVTSAIKCGHTGICWANDYEGTPDSLLFPLDTWCQDSKIYVTNARTNSDEISIKTEILTINGVDVETILKGIFETISADGNIQTSKLRWVNKAFNILCPMYFDYPEHYSVTFKNGNETKSSNLNKYVETEKSTNDYNNDLYFDINSSTQTAILTIKSFEYYNDDFPQFKAFIDSAFHQIRAQSIPYLVIDLRGNGGGDPYCGSYLLEHIANMPYQYWAKDLISNVWQLDLKNDIEPNHNGFKEKPYILVDGDCFSTTGHVCSIIKEKQFGILIGEETGGTFTCNDNSFTMNLEHTGLALSVARRTFSTSVTSLPNDRGVLPDFEMKQTFEDIINNRDLEISYAIKLISTNKKKLMPTKPKKH